MERALGMSIARMKTVQLAAIHVLVADDFTAGSIFVAFQKSLLKTPRIRYAGNSTS
jgi:hypothetical protein